MPDKRVQINKVVTEQLPTHVRDDNPLVGEFLSQYYQAQEYQGAPIDIINNLDSYIQLNKSGSLVGFTTLITDITEFDTQIIVNSTLGYPDSYGLLQLDDEIVTYTGLGTISDSVISGVGSTVHSRTYGTFEGCIRGFSGITSFRNPDEPEEFIFSDSKAATHKVGIGTSGGQVENLSVLFLKEFLRKSKNQFLPGFKKELNVSLNEPQFIRHSKDFYSSRGTDESFKLLFRSLFNEDVSIERPADNVIAPSDANYKKTRDIIIEPIQGDPMDLENKTLFQDEFENIGKAYAPISMVERIRVGLLTDTYYKVSVDDSFGTGGSSSLLYGDFRVHANTRAVGEVTVETVGTAQTYIDVDSTIGFPDKGSLTFQYKNGTVGVATYTSTTTTQFIGVVGITTTIKDAALIKQNTYAYALGKADSTAVGLTTDGIRVRITGVLNDVELPDTFYQKKGGKIKLKSLGKIAHVDDFKSKNWISNISTRYDIDTITVQDASNNTYEVTLEDYHRIRFGDLVTIQTNNTTLDGTYSVTDVISNKILRIRGAAISSLSACVSIKNILTKPNCDGTGVDDNHQYLNNFSANVQNIYMREVGYAHTLSKLKNLVACNSLPSSDSAKLNPSTQKISLSGTYNGGDIIIGITTGTNDHNFFSGDAIYYTPQLAANGTVMSFLFGEGLYFVERINHNDIKLAKSLSNLYDGNYQKISESTVQTTITNNTFEKYDFHNKIIQPQKLFREFDMPVYDGKRYPTKIGYNGLLINGTEVLSYKSKDLVYYGDIKSIDCVGGGRYYDVINPPELAINDGIGVGATGFVATRGKFQEIRVLEPGFDYVETPTVSISGGNGEGAKAECKLVTVPHSVVFNAGSGSGVIAISTYGDGRSAISTSVVGSGVTGEWNVGFLTYHKFRNYERVRYDTQGGIALAGLDTGATYYAVTQNPGTGWSGVATDKGSPWVENKTIRLHRNLNEAVAGVGTINFTDFGTGNHLMHSLNGKAQVGAINLLETGDGYENKHKTCNPVGINTALDRITILNHDYKDGEIVIYTKDPDGTSVEGLTSGNQYYINVIDDNTFKLAGVGIGTTVKDFYYKTKQYENFRSIGVATHNFNYPSIEVKVEGIVGIDSIEGNTFECIPQPLVRGEVTSINLTAGGVGYGASEILNFNRQPQVDLYSGRSCELLAVVADGKIIDVAINNRGVSYNTPPAISVAGVGTGALLVPEIVGGQVVSVKIIRGGVGYGASTTALTVEAAGEFANFLVNMTTWQVNEVQKNYSNIDGSDTFIDKPTQISRGLQISHAYCPRTLRKIVYQNDSEGNSIYGARDLTLLNGLTEEDKTRHSPIIGWAYDGLPIYGPYAYEKSTGGNITQIRSGYSIDYKTNRPPLGVFPSEFFLEDFTWNSNTDEKYLDENNGRYGITPEFPNGTYAYFATFDTSLTNGNLAHGAADPFQNYKKPAFPYLIGDNYWAQPNHFNTLSKSNQDLIDLNDTLWVRNTEPYELLQDSSYYDYLKQSYKYITQEGTVVYAKEGNVEKVGVVTGGSNYGTGDQLVFEEKVADNFQAVAKVSKVDGPGIGTITVTNTKVTGVEFYPGQARKTFIGIATDPLDFQNIDEVYVSGLTTTATTIAQKGYTIGISSQKLLVSQAIGSTAITGFVTYVFVQGTLPEPYQALNGIGIRENDILRIGAGTTDVAADVGYGEQVKVLNVDPASSRIRILRAQNGTVGVAHTIKTPIEERPRKFTISSGFDTSFNGAVDHEYYFYPLEAVGVGTTAGVGIGTTISFENPGAGISRIFIPARSIYLPGHKLKTGDSVLYNRNGGESISISTNRANAAFTAPVVDLAEGVPLFVAKISDDLIGLSTVRIGIASVTPTDATRTPEDVFVGVGATNVTQGLVYFINPGTGKRHSLRKNYADTVKGTIEKNLVTVSTSSTHGLKHNDLVELTIDAGITTTVPIKYNKANRKLIARTLDFTAAGITTTSSLTGQPDSIEIVNHELKTGQRVVHTSSSPATGLINDEEYFVYVITKDLIKLCGSRFQTKQKRPKFVGITNAYADATARNGVLNLVNPALEFYKNGTITFDVSDSSLSYTKITDTLPAFDFELYTDSNFIHEYTSNELKTTFNVTRSGTVGVDGKVVVTYNENTPKILYYNIVPTTSDDNPDVNKELVLDKGIEGNNSVSIRGSRYAGRHKILANSKNTFTYNLDRYPEEPSYESSTDTLLKYKTTSKSAYGPIADVAIADKGRGYTRLPGISTVSTKTGSGAILEASSTSIGKIEKATIENIGFDYPSDFTLRPQSKLPQVIKIDALSGLKSIGITSYGRGYNQPPALVVLDGVTREKDEDVDLRYNLETPDEPGYVDIIENTYGLSNVTPFVVPVANPNGIRVTNLVYDSSTDTVAATMKVAYSLTEEFPLEKGDFVFVENASVGVGSTGKGYDSQYYQYRTFEVTEEPHQNLGNVGIVTYSMNGLVPSGEIPGNFNTAQSSAILVRERDFPQFAPVLVANEFNANETLRSETSVGPVQGVAFEYDPASKWLTVEAASDFEVGKLIESLETGAKGNVSEIVLTFDTNFLLNYYSVVDNGWEYNTGFLSDSLQVVHDNEYYHNFSYAIKSRVFFEKWKDIVNTLTHTSGFRKFSNLQVESTLPVENKNAMVVGTAGTVSGIINIQAIESLHEVKNFDVVTENLKDRSPAAGNFSDEITFKNRILIDYAESIGNRAIPIDNISHLFNSNPRPNPWSEVGRYDISENKENRFIVYVKDSLFTGERQIMMVNSLFDPISGQSMINQYGSVDTVMDLGQMDSVVDGTEAVLQFHPTKSEYNNYNVVTLSMNLDETGVTTSLTALGSTTIGSSSNPQRALVSIGASNVLAGTAHSAISGVPAEVKILTVGTASTTGVALTSGSRNYTSADASKYQLFNPRSAKIIVSVATSEGTVEYNELSLVMHQNVGVGSTVAWETYGQLSIHNRSDSFNAEPLGTFRPYIVGVGTTAAVEIGYTPKAGITTAWINSITIGISSESATGVGTISLRNANLSAQASTIPGRAAPYPVGIASYTNDFDGAYCLIQIKDTLNDTYEFSEVMMIDDDDRVFMTEYGNILTGAGATTGIGTINAKRNSAECRTELTFVPNANIPVEVKTFMQSVKIIEDGSKPRDIELNSGSIKSRFDVYEGTFYAEKTEFPLKNDDNEIFKKNFDGASSTIVDLTNNTITIPNHYFVTGEEIEYRVKQPIIGCTTTGIGSTGDAIGVAATFFPNVQGKVSMGATLTYVPSSVYAIKISDSVIKLASSPGDALKSIAVPLDLSSVGVGTSHSFISKNQNARGLIAIDNIIQSPVVGLGVTTSLNANFTKGEVIMTVSGITSFYSGDDIKVGNEMMKVVYVGYGATDKMKVHRNWLGTGRTDHNQYAVIEKLSGNYNIVDSTINFSNAPFGGEPPVGNSTSRPGERDWVGITTSSSFSGRIFNRSGIKGGSIDAYNTNYVIDDISHQFNGQDGTVDSPFTLKVDKSNVTGIATQLGIVMINGILQGAGEIDDYTLSEVSGISSITFTGLAASVTYDPNNASIPVGGIIVSVGSTEGNSYQPLVGAGATISFNNVGVITNISIGNTGSGYRVFPGPISQTGSAVTALDSAYVGIATEIKVGVALSSTGTPSIQYIGTASVVNGSIVSIAITYTDPIPGIGTQNPISVGNNLGYGASTFNAIIDKPLPYENIPLWYHSSSPGVGGTGARANVIVGAAGSIIDFEITNTGSGYGAGHVLTIPNDLRAGAGSTVGIPTAKTWDGDGPQNEFRLTLERVHHDEFNMWTVGELERLDDFSDLFDGARTAFPLTKAGEAYAIQARTGSNIVINQTIILTINDVLQVPGEGFTFNGGGTITLTEAPNAGDVMNMFFYRGTGGEDVKDRDIIETVKMGDDLQVGFDPYYNTRYFLENDRTVSEVKSSDQVDTNAYYGVGLGDDDTELRPVKWSRQLEDKWIDGRIVRKDRPLYEPNLFPTAYLIQSVGVGSTTLWIDNCKPQFDPENENPVDRNFQKDIQIVDASSNYEYLAGAAATAIVGPESNLTSVAISTGGRGYETAPTVTIQAPVDGRQGYGVTPSSALAGIGTTAIATATATITAGVVSGISIANAGYAYTHGRPPQVLIAPPTYVREENSIDLYQGDYGILNGVGICSNISDANGAAIGAGTAFAGGTGIGTAVVFDFWIPPLSPLRNDLITTPDAITKSGIQTGYYFIVSNSNLGSGVTSLNMDGSYVGVGTTSLDNIFEVSHYVGINTIGFGSDAVTPAVRVFSRVLGWNGLQNQVGYSTLGQGFYGNGSYKEYYGDYNWGRLQLKDRQKVQTYTINTNDGITGIKTGPQVKRKFPLKSTNYVV